MWKIAAVISSGAGGGAGRGAGGGAGAVSPRKIITLLTTGRGDAETPHTAATVTSVTGCRVMYGSQANVSTLLAAGG